MEEEMITITKKEYEDLKDDSVRLGFLEQHGVDNWTWYDDAMKDYWIWKEEESS